MPASILSRFLVVSGALVLATSAPALAQVAPENDPAFVLRVDPLDLQMPVGGSHRATAYFYKAGITKPASGVQWTSKDTKVASIRSDGTVQGLAAGKTTVTAQVGKKRASLNVYIKAK